MYRQSEKKLVKQQYLLQMSTQYGELQPASGWDWSSSLGRPCKFQRVSSLGSVTAPHSSSRCQPNFAALNRGCHLYSAGRLSHWALAHILVSFGDGEGERVWASSLFCVVTGKAKEFEWVLCLCADREGERVWVSSVFCLVTGKAKEFEWVLLQCTERNVDVLWWRADCCCCWGETLYCVIHVCKVWFSSCALFRVIDWISCRPRVFIW